MDRLREMIKEKDFVISPLILKNIKKFNLNVNEFLLLLFFINIDTELNMSKINKFISLSEEEVLSAFDNLVSKGLIEVKVNKEKDKIVEEILLDNLYNKLLLDLPEDKKETDIYSAFEKEFSRTLSPMEYETINKWLEGGVSEDTIKSALKEAVLNGVYNLRYIDKIIYEWTKKKIRISNDEGSTQVFDYNWLEDDNEER
jgi:DNA replication protein